MVSVRRGDDMAMYMSPLFSYILLKAFTVLQCALGMRFDSEIAKERVRKEGNGLSPEFKLCVERSVCNNIKNYK